MSFVVDTSVWSLALRMTSTYPPEQVRKLRVLIEQGETIRLPGIILQELLQGLKSSPQFDTLVEALTPFPILEPERDDYAEAARIYNLCRSRGIQAQTVDSLIAALCIRHDFMLLTTDRDFAFMAAHIPLKLL